MQKYDRGRLLTAAQVADIWNERSREMGYPNTHYTRFSVRQRHKRAKQGNEIVPALKTSVGFLYWEQDARDIPLQPNKSKSRQFSHSKEKLPKIT